MATTDIDKLVIYRRSDDSELVPLDAPTTHLGASATGSTTISLGFTFRFDGADYASVLVLHGELVLAGSPSTNNATMYSSNANVVLAPFWDNSRTAETDGYVRSELQGAAPWRRHVIELRLRQSGQTSTDHDVLTFQAVLYETTDRLEYRYAPREVVGTPATDLSASVGFKGNTTSVTDNYRDLSVDNRTLGGSNTTTTSTNDRAAYDALVGTAIVIEPNWPMCGQYVPVLPSQLTGLQHPYNEPMWAIANNVNWLYCRHAPPLVCWAPRQYVYGGEMHYGIPIKPSYDGLTYRVYLITYSTVGGTIDIEIDRDNAADPQIGDDADWTSITTLNDTGLSAGFYDWPSFTITLAVPSGSVDMLRIVVTPTSGGQVRLQHVLIVPELLDEVPITTTAIEFCPMAIGQLRQRGAGVHPEWYNRAWKSVARVVNDRWQMLWSYGDSDHPDSGVAKSPGRAARIVGASPASLLGWRGVEVDVSCYAWARNDDALLQIVERGGGSIAFEVDNNSDEYRYQSETMELVSEEPMLVVSANDPDEIFASFVGVTWVPGWSDDDLFQGATPAPALEKLLTLVSRIRRACTMPYAMTGHASALERWPVGSSDPVMLRWQVQIATQALRPKIARTNNEIDEVAVSSSILATSSGGGGSDGIIVPSPHSQGREAYPWDLGGADLIVASGSEVYDATPAASGDRLLESPTLTVLDAAVPELVTVVHGVGMCLVCYPADPTAI